MKKRKYLAMCLSAAMVLSFTGCSEDDIEESTGSNKPAWVTTAEETSKQDNIENETTGTEVNPGQDVRNRRTVALSVNRSTGNMVIERMNITNSIKAEEGTWTIFVYMCGADLESDGGLGTADLQEMLAASTGDNVRFVVFTGGASEWNNSLVDSDKIQTYLIQNGEITLKAERPFDNMGDPSLLAECLTEGISLYPASNMGLVFWDHGSGSINGVCFDENNDKDSLSLQELDAALVNTASSTGAHFEFIGFDACLMGTLETANICATYADYMYGSEETEPGEGWDYTAIGNFLGKNNSADGLALGKIVTDSFFDMCEKIGEGDSATFTVYDLSKLDTFIESYNSFYYDIYSQCTEDTGLITDVVKAVTYADNFGGNNKSEGYTNMVDIGSSIVNLSDNFKGSDDVLKALKNLVAYNRNGRQHKSSYGLATYYPLSVQGSTELKVFSTICVSPYYLSIIDMLHQHTNNNVSFDDYSDDGIFSDDGEWSNWLSYIFGDDDEYEADYDEEDDYFDYVDEDNYSYGDSEYITFEQEPVIDDEGNFFFVLDEDGYYNTRDIYANVYMEIEDTYIEMGQIFDVQYYDEFTYSDYFDGYWISLADGQNLALYPIGYDDEWNYYTSPILLNDELVNMHISQNIDEGDIYIDGIWGGIDENGAASRTVYEMEEGDIIVPVFWVSGEDKYYVGYEYSYDPDDNLYYDIMDPGFYYYTFIIEDIYGGYYESPYAEFEVDEDGEVYFYVD